MVSAEYELYINILTITNFLMIILRMLGLSEHQKFMEIWIYMQFVINLLMLGEMLSDFFIHGLIWSYKNTFRIWPETFCQWISFNIFISLLWDDESTIDVIFRDKNQICRMLELIIIVRCSKLATLMYEIKTMRIIMETISNLATPFFNLSLMLLFMTYFFAIWGMFFFGGLNYKGNPVLDQLSSVPPNYYLNNFNDLPSSMLTLFDLLIVNNWFLIMNVYI